MISRFLAGVSEDPYRAPLGPIDPRDGKYFSAGGFANQFSAKGSSIQRSVGVVNFSGGSGKPEQDSPYEFQKGGLPEFIFAENKVDPRG